MPCKWIIAVLALAAIVLGAPQTTLQFEVASIKASPPGGRSGGIRPAPGGQRYVATNVPLKLMLQVAYRVKADQIAGGPAWIESDTFDMNAAAEKPSSVEDLHIMLQNLLKERFKLQMHTEQREHAIYALVVDKAGSKMKPHESANAGDPWIDQGFGKMKATFAPMDFFAWRLSMLLDRPVLDRTGLKGGYDFDLTYLPELPPNFPEGGLINGAPVDTSLPSIFVAVKEQLGLKLDPQKGPVETLVIDHAEKPADN